MSKLKIKLLIFSIGFVSCWSAHGQEPIMMILYGPITIMLSVRILFFKNFRFESKIPALKF